MMKVLYTLIFRDIETEIGGLTAHAIGVIEGFKHAGHEVCILAHGKIPFLDVNDMNYHFFSKRLTSLERFLGRVKLFRDILLLIDNIIQILDIRRVIKKENPDLLYMRWTVNPFLWIGIRKQCTARDITFISECNSPNLMFLDKQDARMNAFKRLVFRLADVAFIKTSDLISAVSEMVKEFLTNNFKINPSRIIVNPNGVDASKFKRKGVSFRDALGIGKDEIVIGMIAHFYDYKQGDLLIEVFQDLVDEGFTSIKLLLVGPAEDMEGLKRIARSRHGDAIIFTGRVPYTEIPRYIETCDILVSPQRECIDMGFHGSPIKIFEYMSMESAIVASRVGQIQETIDHGVNGLLFDAHDKEEFKERLRTLIADPELRRTLGKRAREKVLARYTWDANVRRILDKVKVIRCHE